MAPNSESPEHLLHDLRAREAWSQRDYARAREIATTAIAVARDNKDENSWWNMTFLRAECLWKEGAIKDSDMAASLLQDHALTRNSAALAARVSTLRSQALQELGQLADAAAEARAAVDRAAESGESPDLLIAAHHALIAALAESGEVEEAWQNCLHLDALLDARVNPQTTGKAHWVIGNVAYLRNDVATGTKHHRLASSNLSPTRDLEVWARFNRASAALRLAAKVVEPETLECIERAEMASSIVGETERESLELWMTRAHWLLLTGQVDEAIERLDRVCTQASIIAPQTAGEAHLLLGRAHQQRGGSMNSLLNFEKSKKLFAESGAHDRAAKVDAIMESL